MNSYLKKFLLRGLAFGGFGPIILGVIYAILDATLPNFSLNGAQTCLAIISIYLLAFIQAGASVFNQIEHWPLAKSLFWHFGTLYVAYVTCYTMNTWIPFKWDFILVFTAIFVILYICVWLTVYIITRLTSRKLNKKLAD